MYPQEWPLNTDPAVVLNIAECSSKLKMNQLKKHFGQVPSNNSLSFEIKGKKNRYHKGRTENGVLSPIVNALKYFKEAGMKG